MLAIMEDTVWRHGASDVPVRSVAPGSVGPDPASWEGGCDESESEEEEDASSAHVRFTLPGLSAGLPEVEEDEGEEI